MSNIRSASSRTRRLTRLRFVIFPLEVVSTPMSRPGVPTRMWAPFFRADSCSPIGPPPKAQTLTRPTALQKTAASRWICSASSLVGATAKTMGPSPSARAGWSRTWRIAGRRYASVFPEPVCATPMTSRPHIMAGIACIWMGNGMSYSRFCRIFWIFAGSPHWRKLLMGRGQCFPRTEISPWVRRRSSTSCSFMLVISFTWT
mmetsp:Transcript_71294/g.202178  ORF Transcript_71294/g.202178 Transcript_71294/m.202178 type:complete len:202 (-) Transcript_71294:840-1445(-)